MKEYLALLSKVMTEGKTKPDRTGVGTLSLFGEQLRIDIDKSFPLLTTKKIHLPSVVHELLWFLRGDDNIAYLKQHGITIWDEWADSNGNLGPIYGKQWRRWLANEGREHDQIQTIVDQLHHDPHSRRMMLSAWNVGELDKMKLPPCHLLSQFYVIDGMLSCHLYQRSADVFLGVPFNIASYALLTHMLAQVSNLSAHQLVISFGDVHLYHNHIDQAKTQLARDLKPLPRLLLNPAIKNIADFTADDIVVMGYDPHPAIKAPIAV